MSSRSRCSRTRATALALLSTSPLLATAAGPCDLYAAGGTPCIAAHSTTRALYGAYTGDLYQVKRGSDNATINIAPRSAGGVADAEKQDKFCAGTTCLITTIFDQSPRGNHLTRGTKGAYSGPEANGDDHLASAIGAPVTLNGKNAYGVFVSPGTGYRNNEVNGSAIGDAPQGMYAIFDGTHFNSKCCFDYGNAEPSGLDTGNGHMEALYFGSLTARDGDPGPWVMADLENGVFNSDVKKRNPAIPSATSRFVTAILKGEPGKWAVRGGNSAAGKLQTYFSGARPSGGYDPMIKEGAIVLGVGGDNSPWGQGTFYEGVMTSGYPSDATENAVQDNIVAAKYAVGSLTSGPSYKVGETISLKVTTPKHDKKYLAHVGENMKIQLVNDTNKAQASWTVRTGLGNAACFSLESRDTPNNFVRHVNADLKLAANDGSKAFKEDATFCPQAGLNGKGTTSLRAWSYPAKFVRHYEGKMYIGANGGILTGDALVLFNDDVTFVLGKGFA
jgi:hypothetical protein